MAAAEAKDPALAAGVREALEGVAVPEHETPSHAAVLAASEALERLLGSRGW